MGELLLGQLSAAVAGWYDLFDEEIAPPHSESSDRSSPEAREETMADPLPEGVARHPTCCR
jgi:hypothetical protein